MSASSSQLVRIGAVARAHGVRGALRVRLDNPGSDVLSRVASVRVGQLDFRVRSARHDAAGCLVELEGVGDRDAAEALRGQEVLLPREALPEPDEDELYLADLPGCALVDVGGASLGTVVGVENYGAHELLLVRTPGGEAMLPFVDEYVREVDLAARRIVCEPPEGLFELYAKPGAQPTDDEQER